jgi:hypothetical protein
MQHYHSTDVVNGEQHIHETISDLDLYMRAVGQAGIKTTNCYDPKCLEDAEDAYCSRCDAECSGH